MNLIDSKYIERMYLWVGFLKLLVFLCFLRTVMCLSDFDGGFFSPPHSLFTHCNVLAVILIFKK